MARTSRHRKKQLLPFGDMMIPIVGLIGIGLLFFGIKVFFVSDKEESYKEYVKHESVVAEAPAAAKSPGLLPVENGAEEAGTSFIAVPVISDKDPQSTKSPAQKQPAKKPAAKPTGSTAIKPSKPTQQSSQSDSAGASSWLVQIGSFKQKSMAESLASEAKSKGISATVGYGDVGGVRYYRVLVQGGKSREEANAVGERLKTLGYSYFVFPRK